MHPRFPIYIPSKGRAARRVTMRHLDRMGLPYRVVVEAQEYDAYAAVMDARKLLVLDPVYQESYDTCDDLGASRPRGSGPARNFIWDHAIREGADWHWIMDDNIAGFYRLNRNHRNPVADGTIFRVMEDFCLRYKNVAMAGPHYRWCVPKDLRKNPLIINTRIFSCNLIRNDLPFRWRGRYNEDADLSLRVLKAGWCTVIFCAFQQAKSRTLTVPGGNTDSIYVNGTLEKSRMIARLHPDVAHVRWQYGRWHHRIDYRPFANNRLVRRADLDIRQEIDNYGMELTPWQDGTRN